MSKKVDNSKVSRRTFISGVAVGAAGIEAVHPEAALSEAFNAQSRQSLQAGPSPQGSYPKTYRGEELQTVAFPLGGIGTGTISLGGRGELRDWEIFNRADKGRSPDYCFFSIRAQAGNKPATSRVLESRFRPPYERPGIYRGLGFLNLPGLPRFQEARFQGEYPFARIEFLDKDFPVEARLEAFNPMIPMDTASSSFPVAAFRYTIRNTGDESAVVSIVYSQSNPVAGRGQHCEFKETSGVAGLLFSNPFLDGASPENGTFAVSTLEKAAPDAEISHLKHWWGPFSRDWAFNFWEDFTQDGQLTEPKNNGSSNVGSLCVRRRIEPGQESNFVFLLSWHFPNRTPSWCGWIAPEGHENDPIGNYYCNHFSDAWDAAVQFADRLPDLEARTRRFAAAAAQSTLPAFVLDAAMSNISTLRTNTCFQTADGAFYGFEGTREDAGCCFGNCTHVWNYEQATAFLYPSLARSMRESEFGPAMDEEGRISFRQLLPPNISKTGSTAADGQMGCILKLYREWQLSGDTGWLKEVWPRARKALEFAWIKGGWDSDQDGVMEGVQHNTYDVEFYGPNPQCESWYLGALRAATEMARAVEDEEMADRCARLFSQGSEWVDANLFNGEYYIQDVRPCSTDQIAEGLLLGRGAPRHRPENPFHQVGDGCLVDQLVGQYFAHVVGLGHLLKPQNIRTALESLFRYNFRKSLEDHESVQRVFALNDEAAMLICSFPKGKRPELPFWFSQEVMTGFEYQAAVHMIQEGLVEKGLALVEAIRNRYDGVKRNPWDEAECGHHYSRAMASWALIPALSGFLYSGVSATLKFSPRINPDGFRTFWSTGGGWGQFSQSRSKNAYQAQIEVTEGSVDVKKILLSVDRSHGPLSLSWNGSPIKIVESQEEDGATRVLKLEKRLAVRGSEKLLIST